MVKYMSQDMDYPGNINNLLIFFLLKTKELESNNYNAIERNIFLL